MANPPKLPWTDVFGDLTATSWLTGSKLHQHSVGNLLQCFQRHLNHLLTCDFFSFRQSQADGGKDGPDATGHSAHGRFLNSCALWVLAYLIWEEVLGLWFIFHELQLQGEYV